MDLTDDGTTVAVVGATGYMGRLVTDELVRRGVRPVLVGRDAGRLATAAARTGGAPTRLAGTGDQGALTAAFADAQVVINCATPFTPSAGPVIDAAIAAGVHYVDIGGEALFVHEVFERYDEAAARAGVTVLPAANNDCLTGDLLGHLVAEGMPELETISVAFDATDGEACRGTLLMALVTQDTMRSGGPGWADGHVVVSGPARRTSLVWPGRTEAAEVVKFAMPPAVTLPRHVRTRHAEGLATPAIFSLFGDVTQELVDAMPLRQGPSPDSRARARFVLVVSATGIDGTQRRGVLHGRDMYGTTAVIAVDAALRLVRDPGRPGVAAPAQVLPAAEFLDALEPYGIHWQLSDLTA